MKLLTKEIIARIPPLYAQDGKGDEAIVHVKFFTPTSNWTWYATEASAMFIEDGIDRYERLTPENIKEAEDVIFFGFVTGFEEELGYFSLKELQNVKGPFGLGIERDVHFGTHTLGKIRRGEVR